MTGLVDGRYRLLEVLGSGGMATVWRAFDVRLEREVALKRPHPMAEEDPRRERLIREARLAASVSHPNLVTVHDVGADSDGLYLVMELVEAPSLADVGRQLSPQQVLTVGVQVARALAVVHRRGIVHRDIKPGNILLSSRGAKLTDFGIALNDDPGSRLTEPGMVLATANYAAPEVLAGHPATPAGDVYSLGVVLRELLGRPIGSGLDELLDRATATEAWRRPDAETLATGLSVAERSPVAAGATAIADTALAGTALAGTALAGNAAGSAPTLAMPATGLRPSGGPAHVGPSAPDGRPGTAATDTTFNRYPPFTPEPASSPDPDPQRTVRSMSSRSVVAVIAAVAVFALVGLLVIELFSNAFGRVGDSLESVGDLADGPDVTVPSGDETTEAPSTTSEAGEAAGSTASDSGDPADGDDGGGLGSLFDFGNPLEDLEQEISDAVEAGDEARESARDFGKIMTKLQEAVEKAEEDKPAEAADKLNEAADRIDDRLDGQSREQAMALLEQIASDLGFTINDEDRFEPDQD